MTGDMDDGLVDAEGQYIPPAGRQAGAPVDAGAGKPGQRLAWPELDDGLVSKGWLASFAQPITSSDVLEAIARRHPMDGFGGKPGKWVFVREVQSSTGSYSDVQRFDAVAIGLVPSVKYARVVYEVKVTRSDWLREMRPLVEYLWRGHRTGRRRPAQVTRLSVEQAEAINLSERRLLDAGYVRHDFRKWDEAVACSTEYWVAAPPHVVLPSELPPEAGLLEVRPYGKAGTLRARVVVPAPVRDTPAPGPGFYAAVLREVARR